MAQKQPIAFAVWDPASDRWIITETRNVTPIITPSALPPDIVTVVKKDTLGQLPIAFWVRESTGRWAVVEETHVMPIVIGDPLQTPARPGSDSHARELNAHIDSQVDAGVKLEDKGEEPRPAKRFIEKATETTDNAPTSAENISVATVKTPASKELSTTNKSKTPFRPGVLHPGVPLEGRFIRNPALSQQTTKGRQPLKMNAVSIHATANSYDGLKMPRLPIHKLKPLRNLVTMTLEDVPRPLRQSFDKPIFLDRVNTLSYGMKHDRELNGGWCYKELCTDQICPLGEECPYSHCPPDRNTCLWLLQVDTRARDNIHHRLARGFLFNCFNNYWQKYYQFGLCPILSPLQRGVPMSRLSDDAQPVQLAFERPDDIFESEKCKDIIDEWQFLNDLHATITQTFNPTAPVRSGIQSNTRNSQGAGTESKRAAASEMTSIEQLRKKLKLATDNKNAYGT